MLLPHQPIAVGSKSRLCDGGPGWIALKRKLTPPPVCQLVSEISRDYLCYYNIR